MAELREMPLPPRHKKGGGRNSGDRFSAAAREKLFGHLPAVGRKPGPAAEPPLDVGSAVRRLGELAATLSRQREGSVLHHLGQLLFQVGGAAWAAEHRGDPGRLAALAGAVTFFTATQDAPEAP
jgi:hypothetical protein